MNWLRSLLVLLLMAGCSVMKLREEAQTFYATAILVGRVEYPAAPGVPLLVAAYRMQEGRLQIVHYTRLHEAGAFELMVPMGRFRVFAFADANGNYRYDAGEASGQYRGPQGDEVEVTPALGGIVPGLDFVLGGVAPTGIAVGTRLADPPPAQPHSSQVGAVMSLDDARFGAQEAQRGYWAPVEFYRELGGNIYFLEPYDPHKIPLLFVHGAQGSPQDFKSLLATLDRSRYQAWFYYYPSGAAVESMAQLLYWKLLNLQLRYAYPRLYITAHSMGGLVVRNFLENFGGQFPQVQLFVSIATPWGGDGAAESGVRYSPAVVPAWEDMRPEGRFMRSLFQKPLPASIPYYLFFAHHGSPGLWRPNNDGTVTLASQLRPAAQQSARQVFGFDEGHVGVLASPDLQQRHAALLKALDQPIAAGRLRVHLHSPPGAPGPIAMLRLTPREAGREPLLTTLDQTREIGMLAPGEYSANVFAYGFSTEQDAGGIRIEADQTSTLNVRLKPLRALSGYVVEPLRAGAQAAGQFRRMDEAVKIRSISLHGSAGTRQLKPDPAGDGNSSIDHYLAGRDYAFGAGFSFLDLAPGQYRLRVEAEGYAPHESDCLVTDEAPAEPRLIELQPR